MALWRRRRRRRRCHQHYITHRFKRHSNTKNTSSPVVRCCASRYQTVGTSPIIKTTLVILSKNHLSCIISIIHHQGTKHNNTVFRCASSDCLSRLIIQPNETIVPHHLTYFEPWRAHAHSLFLFILHISLNKDRMPAGSCGRTPSGWRV